ncbi:hypothetical protein Gotur_018590 [Gossypium turneri]
MGGGNGQKSRMAREKHMEKNKPTKGKHTFICTTSEVKCKEHAEAKHPKDCETDMKNPKRIVDECQSKKGLKYEGMNDWKYIGEDKFDGTMIEDVEIKKFEVRVIDANSCERRRCQAFGKFVED